MSEIYNKIKDEDKEKWNKWIRDSEESLIKLIITIYIKFIIMISLLSGIIYLWFKDLLK